MNTHRSFLNPYAGDLGQAAPLDVLEASAPRLNAMIWPLTAEHLARRSGPDKWNIRAIVCHLADMEIVFGFRLRQTLSEPHHMIQVCDQAAWSEYYERMDVAEALEVFRAMRSWNVALIRTAGPAAWSRPVTHPERGVLHFGSLVETMAGHDLHHFQQLQRLQQLDTPR